jgi:hypothetical protein
VLRRAVRAWTGHHPAWPVTWQPTGARARFRVSPGIGDVLQPTPHESRLEYLVRVVLEVSSRLPIDDWTCESRGPRRRGGRATAHDEHDAYVGGVYRLLASGAAAPEIAAHVSRVQGDVMGLAAEASRPLARCTENGAG